jgi:hypothetical protein
MDRGRTWIWSIAESVEDVSGITAAFPTNQKAKYIRVA